MNQNSMNRIRAMMQQRGGNSTGIMGYAHGGSVDDIFGTGNIFTETTPGASTINFGNSESQRERDFQAVADQEQALANAQAQAEAQAEADAQAQANADANAFAARSMRNANITNLSGSPQFDFDQGFAGFPQAPPQFAGFPEAPSQYSDPFNPTEQQYVAPQNVAPQIGLGQPSVGLGQPSVFPEAPPQFSGFPQAPDQSGGNTDSPLVDLFDDGTSEDIDANIGLPLDASELALGEFLSGPVQSDINLSASDGSQTSPRVMTDLSLGSELQNIKDRVAVVEGTDDDNAYNRLLDKGEIGTFANSKPLSEMTVAEAISFGQSDEYRNYSRDVLGRGPNELPSTPMGKYQIVGNTLADLVKRGIVDASAPFNAETQEQLGDYLINNRGYDKLQSGEITRAEFEANLGKEFEGISKQGLGDTSVNASTSIDNLISASSSPESSSDYLIRRDAERGSSIGDGVDVASASADDAFRLGLGMDDLNLSGIDNSAFKGRSRPTRLLGAGTDTATQRAGKIDAYNAANSPSYDMFGKPYSNASTRAIADRGLASSSGSANIMTEIDRQRKTGAYGTDAAIGPISRPSQGSLGAGGGSPVVRENLIDEANAAIAAQLEAFVPPDLKTQNSPILSGGPFDNVPRYNPDSVQAAAERAQGNYNPQPVRKATGSYFPPQPDFTSLEAQNSTSPIIIRQSTPPTINPQRSVGEAGRGGPDRSATAARSSPYRDRRILAEEDRMQKNQISNVTPTSATAAQLAAEDRMRKNQISNATPITPIDVGTVSTLDQFPPIETGTQRNVSTLGQVPPIEMGEIQKIIDEITESDDTSFTDPYDAERMMRINEIPTAPKVEPFKPFVSPEDTRTVAQKIAAYENLETKNSLRETLANLLTPLDGARYINGQLVNETTGESLEGGGFATDYEGNQDYIYGVSDDFTNNTAVNTEGMTPQQANYAKADQQLKRSLPPGDLAYFGSFLPGMVLPVFGGPIGDAMLQTGISGRRSIMQNELDALQSGASPIFDIDGFYVGNSSDSTGDGDDFVGSFEKTQNENFLNKLLAGLGAGSEGERAIDPYRFSAVPDSNDEIDYIISQSQASSAPAPVSVVAPTSENEIVPTEETIESVISEVTKPKSSGMTFRRVNSFASGGLVTPNIDRFFANLRA